MLDSGLLDAYEADLVALLERTLPATLGEVRDGVGVAVAERVSNPTLPRGTVATQGAAGSTMGGAPPAAPTPKSPPHNRTLPRRRCSSEW